MEETKQKAEPKIVSAEEKYNELLNEYHKLTMAYDNLKNNAMQMQEALYEKRIEYLFKVVENAMAFDEKFVKYCTKEIERTFFEASTETEQKNGE